MTQQGSRKPQLKQGAFNSTAFNPLRLDIIHILTILNSQLMGVLIDFNYVLDRFYGQIQTQDTQLPQK